MSREPKPLDRADAFRGHALPLILIGIAALTASCDRSPRRSTEGAAGGYALGINTDGLAYYGTEVPLLNSFKLSAPWLTQCNPFRDPNCQPGKFVNSGGNNWNTREQDKLDLDAEGYPRTLPQPAEHPDWNFTTVSTLVPTGLNPDHPAGRFVVLYEGQGALAYSGGAIRNASLSAPGRDTLDVTTDGRKTVFQLSINATDPGHTGDHIRNIRVLPSGTGGVCSDDPARQCTTSGTEPACGPGARCIGYEQASADHPFHPRFLANLKGFRAIRLMSMQNINNALTENWQQRARVERATWVADHGDTLPVETIADLSNESGTDVWVNMPTRAEDDYVRQFAGLLRDRLNPERHVWVEYSNEAWNTAFAAGTWIEQRAQARWPTESDPPYDKRLQWYGMRSAQICDIWKQVWNGAEDRVVCVIATQAANAASARKALDCPLWAAEGDGTPCYLHHIGALAIAPYFGYYLGNPRHLPTLQSWARQPDGGLDDLFGELFDGGGFTDSPAGGALADARRQIEQSAPIAHERGLALVGYEGGQHVVGLRETLQDRTVTDLFSAANRDPRMGDAYRRHLEDWRESGGTLYNLWLSVGPYSIWGNWGLLEFRDQGVSPKFDAVRQALSGQSPPPVKP